MNFLSLFLRQFYRGYFPADASWFFLHIITILIILGIVLKIRQKYWLTKQIFNLILVLGIIGTLYGMTLLLKALGQPAIPTEELSFYFFKGLGHAIQPLILAFFGWLIVSVMDLFMKQDK